MQKITILAGLLLLLHATNALQSSRQGLAATQHAAGTRHTVSNRRLQAWYNPSNTRGMGLEYQLAVQIDPARATALVAQLANATVDKGDSLTLMNEFTADLSTALSDKVAQLYPPGMKNAIVSQLQPGSPVTCKVVMYADLQSMTDGYKELPCNVMVQTDTWMKSLLHNAAKLSELLGPGLVLKYALQSITVTASGSNAESIKDCRSWLPRQLGWSTSSSPVYITGIIVPGVVFVVVLAMKYRKRLVQLVAGNGTNPGAGTPGQVPADPVPAAAAAGAYGSATTQQGQQLDHPYGYAAGDKPGASDGSDNVAHVYAADSTGPVVAPAQETFLPAPAYANAGQNNTSWPSAADPYIHHPVTDPQHQYYDSTGPSGHTSNTVLVTAGGPIQRRQSVWSRMFGGPQRM